MSLTKLLAAERVRRHRTSEKEISSLRALVERDLRDARLRELSPDRAFAIAYNAALQLSTMVLACAGYRVSPSLPGHHQTTLEAARLALHSECRPLLDYFETCRRMRNTIDYDYAEVVTNSQAQELLRNTEAYRKLVEEWIAECHSGLRDSR